MKKHPTLTRLTGPLLSVLIHVLIIVVLVYFVGHFIKPVDEALRTDITWKTDPNFDPTKVDWPEPEPDIEISKNMVDDPSLQMPVPDTDVFKNQKSIEPSRQSETEGRRDFDQITLPPTQVGVILKDYANRSKDGQHTALDRHANKKHVVANKRAVYRALNWLRDNQRPDGGWDSNGKDSELAVTGLATLSFLANGFTPGDARYGQTMESALKFLVRHQAVDGTWGREYSHAICTYAMAEAYAMTHLFTLRDPVVRAVPHITQGMNIREVARRGSMQPVPGLDQPKEQQLAAGLWDYKYQTDTDRFDTSVSGWQIQALKAAKMARLKDPTINRALRLASNGLKHMQSERTGKIGYTSPGTGSDWMTGVGALSMMMTGDARTPEVAQAMQALNSETCMFAEAKPSSFYGWYYLTQVKFQQQGEAWTVWRDQFVPEFLRNQERDGSWKSPSAGEGHGNENQYGRAYTTSLGVLTMSVFYRSELMTNNSDAFDVAERPADAVANEKDIELTF